MKRVLVQCSSPRPLLACGASLVAQSAAPEIAFEANADLLKMPDNIYVGEVGRRRRPTRRARSSSTRAPAIRTRRSATTGRSTHGGSRLFQFDQTGKFVREIGQGVYGFNAAHGARRSAGQHLGGRSGASQVIKFDPERPRRAGARPQARSDRACVRRAGRGGAAAGGRGARRSGGRGRGGARPRRRRTGAAARARAAAGTGRRRPRAGGPPGAGIPGRRFNRPTDVAWDAAGNIYVADGARRATRASRSSTRTASSSSSGDQTGSEPGQFNALQGIAHRRAGQRLRRRRGQQAHPGVRRRRQVQVAVRQRRHAAGDVHHARRARSISTSRTPAMPRRHGQTARSTRWSSTARSSASSGAPGGCRRSSAWPTRSTAAARTSCWSARSATGACRRSRSSGRRESTKTRKHESGKTRKRENTKARKSFRDFVIQETTMRVLVICAIAAAAIATRAAAAPILPIVDHVHLNVPDQATAVEWCQKQFGGAPTSEAPDRLMFGDTRLIFLKNDKGQPSTGSALDHIGFSFADLDAKMKELEAAGVKVVTPVRDVQGLFKLGFVEDPWGTRIEVVQDPEQARAASRAPAGAGSGRDAGVVQGEIRRRHRQAEGPHRRPALQRRVASGAARRRRAERRPCGGSHRLAHDESRRRRRRS